MECLIDFAVSFTLSGFIEGRLSIFLIMCLAKPSVLSGFSRRTRLAQYAAEESWICCLLLAMTTVRPSVMQRMTEKEFLKAGRIKEFIRHNYADMRLNNCRKVKASRENCGKEDWLSCEALLPAGTCCEPCDDSVGTSLGMRSCIPTVSSLGRDDYFLQADSWKVSKVSFVRVQACDPA